jgi:hypothetical protein
MPEHAIIGQFQSGVPEKSVALPMSNKCETYPLC